MIDRSLFDTSRIPFGWAQAGLAVLAYVIISAVGAAVGFLLMEVLVPAGVGSADEEIAEWFVNQRTADLNTLSNWGSGLADTPVVIGAVVVLVAVFLVVRRRWTESLVLLIAIALEVLTFVTITYIAGRDRPDVERLDPAPPTSSFPSGHTAAAVVLWLGLALVLAWHFRHEIARWLIVFAGALAAAAVGVSRMYRGMHHLSDVIAGAVLGGVALIVAIAIVNHGSRNVPGEGVPVGEEHPEVRA